MAQHQSPFSKAHYARGGRTKVPKDVAGWVIRRDPQILQGAGNYAAFGRGFHVGFNKLHEAKTFAQNNPPHIRPTYPYNPDPTVRRVGPDEDLKP